MLRRDTQHLPVHAVLLAAGASTRFGAADKLMADVGGEPLVARVARRLMAADLDGITAVIADSSNGRSVAEALSTLDVSVIMNPGADRGMGSSIACGVAAVTDPAAGIMIVPGDMPLLDRELIQQLVGLYRASGGAKIVHPVTEMGEQRNPVLWPAALRAELLALDGAAGGKQLLAFHKASTVTHATSSRVFEDIDTQDDLMRFRSGNS